MAGSGRRLLAATALAAGMASTGGAVAQTGQVFFFGDSLSDTGNAAGFSAFNNAGIPTDPNPGLYTDAAGTPTWRFSNGPVWIDQLPDGSATGNALSLPRLAGLYGVPAGTLDTTDFVAGPAFNFALGGARSGAVTQERIAELVPAPSGVLLQDIPVALALDPDFADRISLGVLDQVNVFNSFVAAAGQAPADFANDRAVIWVGGNDYIGDGLAPDVVLGNIATGMGQLRAAGIDDFVLFNLPDLGNIALANELRTQPDGAAQAALLSTASGLHNAGLVALAERMGDTGASVAVVDIETLFDDVIANPGAYGFADATASCYSLGAMAPTGACGAVPPFDATGLAFFDSIHPTTAAHALVARTYLGTLHTIEAGPATLGVAGQASIGLAELFRQTASARLRSLRNGTAQVVSAGGFDPTARQFAGLGDDLLRLEAGVDQVAQAMPLTDVDRPWGVYVMGNLATGDRDATSGLAAFDYDAWALSVGADYRVDAAVVVGASIGFGRGETDLAGGLGDSEVDSIQATAYASVDADGFFADLTVAYSDDSYDIRRATGGVPATARAETDGIGYGGSVDVGYRFDLGPVRAGPTAGLRGSVVEIDGYSETGAGALGLTVGDQNVETFIASIGAQATGRFDTADARVTPEVRVRWDQRFGADDDRVTAALTSGQQIDSTVDRGDDGVLVVGVGLTLELPGGFSAQADYEGSLWRDDGTDHRAMGKLQFNF